MQGNLKNILIEIFYILLAALLAYFSGPQFYEKVVAHDALNFTISPLKLPLLVNILTVLCFLLFYFIINFIRTWKSKFHLTYANWASLISGTILIFTLSIIAFDLNNTKNESWTVYPPLSQLPKTPMAFTPPLTNMFLNSALVIQIVIALALVLLLYS
jgi:hypothetical protein